MIRYLWPLRLACCLVAKADELRAKLADAQRDVAGLQREGARFREVVRRDLADARADVEDAVAEMENEKTNAASWFSAFMALGEEFDSVTAERESLRNRLTRCEARADRRWRERDEAAARADRWAACAKGSQDVEIRALADLNDARGEADTLENLCHMAERERDAAREAGAAEAFALRQELAEVRRQRDAAVRESTMLHVNIERMTEHVDAQALAGLEARQALATERRQRALVDGTLARVELERDSARAEAERAKVVSCCYCGKPRDGVGTFSGPGAPLCCACMRLPEHGGPSADAVANKLQADRDAALARLDAMLRGDPLGNVGNGGRAG